MKIKTTFSYFFLTLFFIFGGFLFFIPQTQAAVAPDSTSFAQTGSNTATTLTWSHNVSGTDKILIVGVSINGNRTVSSVTYRGLALTRIATANSGTTVRASLWYLLSPPTGGGSVVVTLSGAARFTAGASSYTGVNQNNPLGTPAVNTGSSGTLSTLNINSASNELVVDVLARRGDLVSNPITPNVSQTQRWNTRTTINNTNSGMTGGGSSKSGTSLVTMSWNWASSRAWAAAGVSLKPTPPPSDTTPPLRFSGLPSGTLPSDTTETNIMLNTDEAATCKYGSLQNISYAEMSYIFEATGSIFHQQSITGLADGNSFQYFVRCSDGSGNANADDFLISFNVDSPPPPPPDTQAPSQPTNLSAVAISPTQVSLSWDASTDDSAVEGYKVYRDGSYKFTSSDTAYLDTDLAENTTYSYWVIAVDIAGNESVTSDAASVTTPASVVLDTTPPTSPTNLTAIPISSSQISLSWSAATDDTEVTGYKIYRDGQLIDSQVSTNHLDTGLEEITTYTYTIKAFDTAGNESTESETVEVTTLSVPPPSDILPPLVFDGIPSGVLPAETLQVELAVSTDELASCRYMAEPNVSYESMDSFFSGSNGTIHTATVFGLIEGQEYFYYVRCQDNNSNINENDYLISFSIAIALDIEPPTVPSNISLDFLSPAQVDFSWSPSSDNVGVIGYKIYRDEELIASTNETNYSGVGVVELTTYSYTVAAYDQAGNESARSEALMVNTPSADNLPPEISNITALGISNTEATIIWQTDEPATSQVDYGFTTAYAQTANMDSEFTSNHSILLPNLSVGTTYNYRVRSTDSSGNEAISFNYTFTTLPGLDLVAPAAVELSATNIGQTSVDLIWISPGDNANEGIASEYDIRFSGVLISASNWDSVPKLTGVTKPAFTGTIEKYIVVGLMPNTQYYFAIKTTDAVGNISEISNILSIKTLTSAAPVSILGSGGGGAAVKADIIPPGLPTNVTGLTSSSQVHLRWQNPTDLDFVRVLIIRRENFEPISISDGQSVYEGNDEEFIDIDVEEGKIYYYAIFAYDRIPNYSLPVVIKVQSNGELISQPILAQELDDQNIVDPLELFTKEGNSETPDLFTTLPFTTGSGLTFDRALSFGMRSLLVSQLQKLLSRNSNIYPEGLVTGYYGELTRNAVKRFQCALGIICSGTEKTTGYGSIDSKTAQILNSSDILTQIDLLKGSLYRNLIIGSRGRDVVLLQTFLRGNQEIYPEGLVTGYYWNLTQRAIQRLQCEHNIICSGSPLSTGYGNAGPRTRVLINRLYNQY